MAFSSESTFPNSAFLVASIMWVDPSMHFLYKWFLCKICESLVITWMLCDQNTMGKIKYLFISIKTIQIDVKWWKYNRSDRYNIITINYAYSIKGSFHTILSYDHVIEFNIFWTWTWHNYIEIPRFTYWMIRTKTSTSPWCKDHHYIVYGIWFHLLFEITQCYNFYYGYFQFQSTNNKLVV